MCIHILLTGEITWPNLTSGEFEIESYYIMRGRLRTVKGFDIIFTSKGISGPIVSGVCMQFRKIPSTRVAKGPTHKRVS